MMIADTEWECAAVDGTGDSERERIKNDSKERKRTLTAFTGRQIILSERAGSSAYAWCAL